MRACGLLALPNSQTVSDPPPATFGQLKEFHSGAYLRALQDAARGRIAVDDAAADEFGLCDDCAPFPALWEHATRVCGATLAAAQALIDGVTDGDSSNAAAVRTSVCWAGGRHHARSDEAAGFCFCNDVVLALLRLSDVPALCPVLCVDVDVHHGDGTQDAFYHSSDVVAVSFHRRAPGFFPGSGAETETGAGAAGRGRTINVPIRGPVDCDAYRAAFSSVVSAAKTAFNPRCVVLVLGTDAVAGDEIGGLGLSSDCIVDCARIVLGWGLPTLMLGGGGYVATTAARVHTAMAAAALGVDVPDEIPDHDDFAAYTEGGNGFSMHVPACQERCTMTAHDRDELSAVVDRTVRRLLQL